MNEITKINVADAFKHLGVGRRLGESIVSGFTWISCRGKVWKLHHQGEIMPFRRKDDGTPSPYLDVVIVGENPNTSKIFYKDVYSDGAANPPDCASLNGKEPDVGVPEPQSKLCGTCRWNAFGSALNGGRGKACQDHKRIAVLIMPYMTTGMLDKPLIEPVFLKIPADSLRSWKIYTDSLWNRGAHWAAVITRITFAADENFRMAFELKQPLTNHEAPVVLPLLEDPQTLNIVGGGEFIERNFTPALPEPPVETGLLEAFGTASKAASGAPKPPSPPPSPHSPSPPPAVEVKRGRGRPPGSLNKPKLVQVAPADEDDGNSNGGAEEDGEQQFKEASDGLVDRVAELLRNKTSGMLK